MIFMSYVTMIDCLKYILMVVKTHVIYDMSHTYHMGYHMWNLESLFKEGGNLMNSVLIEKNIQKIHL